MADAKSPDGGSYAAYRQDHRYETDRGVVVSASANRTGVARLLRVHGGYAKRVTEFKAVRAGAPPLIPTAADTPNDTLTAHTLSVPLPTFDQKLGRFTFTVTGQYTYLQNAPRVPGVDVFPTGRYPYALEPLDTVSGSVFAAVPGLAAILAGANVIADLTNAVGLTTNVAAPYTWYLTALPPQTFTPLISG